MNSSKCYGIGLGDLDLLLHGQRQHVGVVRRALDSSD